MFLIFYFLGADPAILLVESSFTVVYIKKWQTNNGLVWNNFIEFIFLY